MRKARVLKDKYYEEVKYEKTRLFCQDCGKRQVWEEAGYHGRGCMECGGSDEANRICLNCDKGEVAAQLRARRVTKTNLPSFREYWSKRTPFPASAVAGELDKFYRKLLLDRAVPDLVSGGVFPAVGKYAGQPLKFKLLSSGPEEEAE